MMNKNREAFEQFLKENPTAYTEFKRRVDQLWARGIRRYSADAILHVIRFHSALDARPQDQFKVNNNHAAFMARMWQKDNPDRSSFFETRIQKSAL